MAGPCAIMKISSTRVKYRRNTAVVQKSIQNGIFEYSSVCFDLEYSNDNIGTFCLKLQKKQNFYIPLSGDRRCYLPYWTDNLKSLVSN